MISIAVWFIGEIVHVTRYGQSEEPHFYYTFCDFLEECWSWENVRFLIVNLYAMFRRKLMCDVWAGFYVKIQLTSQTERGAYPDLSRLPYTIVSHCCPVDVWWVSCAVNHDLVVTVVGLVRRRIGQAGAAVNTDGPVITKRTTTSTHYSRYSSSILVQIVNFTFGRYRR